MSKAFFTNSGTEAIEGALKAAKKYAYVRDGHADHEIIAMNHSCHGRIGALSVTRTAACWLTMGGVVADFLTLSMSFRSQIDYAIAEEPRRGIIRRRLRPEREDIMLIFDEIQCR